MNGKSIVAVLTAVAAMVGAVIDVISSETKE